MERRFNREVSVRASDDGDFCIDGYGATFGDESTDDNLGFRERIQAGAFARSIRSRADVRCLRNHDANFVLGRVKNGTLQLREDGKGLHYRCQLDQNNPDHRAMYASIRRGDIDECSFGFIAQDQFWDEGEDGRGQRYPRRTLKDVDLLDVSPVTFPAYGNTKVQARAADLFPDGIPVEIRSRFPKLESHLGVSMAERCRQIEAELSSDRRKQLLEAESSFYKL